MEEKKEMDEGLFKSRSYLSCLNEGLKLPTRHILSLLRFCILRSSRVRW